MSIVLILPIAAKMVAGISLLFLATILSCESLITASTTTMSTPVRDVAQTVTLLSLKAATRAIEIRS